MKGFTNWLTGQREQSSSSVPDQSSASEAAVYPKGSPQSFGPTPPTGLLGALSLSPDASVLPMSPPPVGQPVQDDTHPTDLPAVPKMPSPIALEACLPGKGPAVSSCGKGSGKPMQFPNPFWSQSVQGELGIGGQYPGGSVGPCGAPGPGGSVGPCGAPSPCSSVGPCGAPGPCGGGCLFPIHQGGHCGPVQAGPLDLMAQMIQMQAQSQLHMQQTQQQMQLQMQQTQQQTQMLMELVSRVAGGQSGGVVGGPSSASTAGSAGGGSAGVGSGGVAAKDQSSSIVIFQSQPLKL